MSWPPISLIPTKTWRRPMCCANLRHRVQASRKLFHVERAPLPDWTRSAELAALASPEPVNKSPELDTIVPILYCPAAESNVTTLLQPTDGWLQRMNHL